MTIWYFFCYLLITIIFVNIFFHSQANSAINQIKEELADNLIKIEEPFFHEDSADTLTEVGLS